MPRTKYRKEISTTPAHPSDNDYYAITISPPITRDDIYCRVSVRGRNWGRPGRKFETRSDAIEYIHRNLDKLEEKSLTEKKRCEYHVYPEPPKPSNTRYVVHPDYDGEIGPREIWGDATLGSFGVASQSRYETQPWYQTREAYTKWASQLRESELVLRIFAKELSSHAYCWFAAAGDTAQMVEYQFGRPYIKATPIPWTSVTRRVGGIGLTRAKPLDYRYLPVERTPFRVGPDEDAIKNWLQQHPPEPPSTEEPNPTNVEKLVSQ